MSKLNFKEDGYYDSVSDTGGDADDVEAMTFDADSDDGVKDSYSLFGIEPGNKSALIKEKKNKKHKKDKKDVEIERNYSTTIGSSDEMEEGAAVEETKSIKKKRKKRKLSASTYENIEVEDSVVKALVGSSFLSKFLSKKREAVEVPEPPEIELPNDSFLRMFQDSFKSHEFDHASALVESDDDEDSLPAYQPTGKKEGLKLSGIHKADSNTSLNTSSDPDVEVIHKEEPTGPITAALQFFNLPYRVSTEQVSTSTFSYPNFVPQ